MKAAKKLEFYKSKIGTHGIKDWREVARKGHYWSKSLARRYPVYNPPIKDSKTRWVEDTSDLRFVGYSDEISTHIRHKGWFADNFQDETYRGAVWRLPAKNGKERFVFGYQDSCNEPAALIDFDWTDDELDAALRADSMAEYDAVEAREYYAKDAAEREIEELKAEIIDIKATIKELLSERRELKMTGLTNDTVCGLFSEKVKNLLYDVKSARERIEELSDNYWLAVE